MTACYLYQINKAEKNICEYVGLQNLQVFAVPGTYFREYLITDVSYIATLLILVILK